jgi:hypothetical protein
MICLYSQEALNCWCMWHIEICVKYFSREALYKGTHFECIGANGRMVLECTSQKYDTDWFQTDPIKMRKCKGKPSAFIQINENFLPSWAALSFVFYSVKQRDEVLLYDRQSIWSYNIIFNALQTECHGFDYRLGSSDFFLVIPSCRTRALGSTQPVAYISSRHISWWGKGGRRVGLIICQLLVPIV